MKKTFIYLFAIFTLGFFVTSCGDDTPAPVTGEALFTYVADGFTVTFTNTSTVSGTVTYAWDFGDGETSTDKDPVHTYAGKGEYTVTLTVTDEQGDTHTVSTKIAVDKKTRIFLDDNTIDDWNAVTEEEFIIPLGDNSGVIKQVKCDYDADFIYFLVTFEGSLTDSTIFNALIDSDVSETGFISTLWPKLGADYLWQGQIDLGADAWLGAFEYTGADHAWGWNDITATLPADFFVFGGSYVTDNNTVSYEVGFSRSKVPGLDGDSVKFTLYLANKGWAEIGYAPDKAVDGGDPTDGFTLNMK